MMNADEYVKFIKILTEILKNCGEVRALSVLTGDTIMLTPMHQLSIESHINANYDRCKIILNRITDNGMEYLIVDNGMIFYKNNNVRAALAEFYEELAFYAPEEGSVETLDIVKTLEYLFKEFSDSVKTSYISSYA